MLLGWGLGHLMSVGASFAHLTRTSVTLIARKTIPAQVSYILPIPHSQKPFQVDTHFTDAETDSMPAQRPLLTKPHHQPPQENAAHVNLVGSAGSGGLGGKLGKTCATTEPPTLLREQTLSCYILTAHCRGLSESHRDRPCRVSGWWAHPFLRSAFSGQLPQQGRSDSQKGRAWLCPNVETEAHRRKSHTVRVWPTTCRPWRGSRSGMQDFQVRGLQGKEFRR